MNERKTLNYNDGVLQIGGVSATQLACTYGTPLYVFDEQFIEDMCHVFSSSLRKHYGDGMISYASKAFCTKEIYRIISKFGLGADVVSAGELHTALSVNFPCEKLIFHGNNKTYEELLMAVNNNVKYIVLDSTSELDTLNEICQNLNKMQDVLVRVNPGVEAHTHKFIQTAKVDSKFGFSIENGDALVFIKEVVNNSNLNLVGLHCHIGSQIFEKQSFVLAVEKMTDFYAKCKKEIGIDFKVLDLGGGFGIYYSGNDPKVKPSDYEEYVEIISKSIIDNFNKNSLQKPFLILEPGRCIVGEAGLTLYSVGSVKEIKDVKNYVSIDGGMFENPRFALYQAQYSVIPVVKTNKHIKEYSIAGKCCESGDLIAENVLLPTVEKGDLLAVLSTGAYNYSMASNYNRNLIPSVVMVKNGVSRVVVKRQSLDDLIKNDL